MVGHQRAENDAMCERSLPCAGVNGLRLAHSEDAEVGQENWIAIPVEEAHVGGILDLVAVSVITGKNIFPQYFPDQNLLQSIVKRVEWIAMMICYCQGTGCSLRSQWERQESIFVASGLTALKTLCTVTLQTLYTVQYCEVTKPYND